MRRRTQEEEEERRKNQPPLQAQQQYGGPSPPGAYPRSPGPPGPPREGISRDILLNSSSSSSSSLAHRSMVASRSRLTRPIRDTLSNSSSSNTPSSLRPNSDTPTRRRYSITTATALPLLSISSHSAPDVGLRVNIRPCNRPTTSSSSRSSPNGTLPVHNGRTTPFRRTCADISTGEKPPMPQAVEDHELQQM